ncbi:MAG TPA: Trk family potassium uptake protein, partial [Clostridiales bacterium]|nr:Trk family potassium uptake protein [Clostridiales bacterium]
ADTGTQFSLYGQIVIITLIQIGGLGFITFMTLFSIFIKRKISLSERKLIMQSTGTLQIGGTVKLVRRIALGTLLFEGCGALILAIRFS